MREYLILRSCHFGSNPEKQKITNTEVLSQFLIVINSHEIIARFQNLRDELLMILRAILIPHV